MHQHLQGATFHIEHVVPRSRGGLTEFWNLAWACPSCNLRKADRIEIPDLHSGSLVILFNPRNHVWEEHFAWNGFEIAGLTPIGGALIAEFGLNQERRIRIRHAEQLFGLFPPKH
jgi:hypothetical protein